MLPRLFGNRNPECVHNGSLAENGSGKFGDITARVLDELKELAVTHVWYTGIIRHATDGDQTAKGKAGSPYAIKDYYDVNPYMASHPENRMGEFEELVSRTHSQGLKVLIDFIPNHLSREYNSEVAPFGDENFYPGRIHDGDWTDTVKLNYGSRDTWEKMRDILMFWAAKGVDGFRCDMVELVTVDFWEWCIPQIKMSYPGIIFIAEIYQPHNYHPYIRRGGFDYLYDKSGFYDTLRSISSGHTWASSLTSVWQGLGDFQPNMLNFLENHDEQRVASDFFVGDPYKSLAMLYVSLFFNTAPFMIYFGQELGERGMETEGYSGVDGRTTIYDFWSLSSIRRFLSGMDSGDVHSELSDSESEILSVYRKLMKQSMETDSFREGKTFDLMYVNPQSGHFDPRYHFAFLRSDGKEVYLVVANFSQWDATIRVNIPHEAFEYFGLDSYTEEVMVSVKAFDGGVVQIASEQQ
jgi:glycosidase